MKINKLNSILNKLPFIIKDILAKEYYEVNSNVKPSKYFESSCQDIIIKYLKENIPNINFFRFIASEYPDIKFELDGNLYAIDIKTAKFNNAPAFDLAYLATYEAENLQYEAEWVVSIGYNDSDVINSLEVCYINQLHELVSVKRDGYLSCGGNEIKLRPISWKRIDNRDYSISTRDQLTKLVNKTLSEKVKRSKYRDTINRQKSKGVVNKFTHDKNLDAIAKNIASIIKRHHLQYNEIQELGSLIPKYIN